MTPNRVIFIVGPAEHGKSTARTHICAKTGLKGGSCSDLIYPQLAQLWGIDEPALRQMDKASIRPHLVELGNLITARDMGRLVELSLMHGIRVLDGIRRYLEYKRALAIALQMGFRPVTIAITRTDANAPRIRDNFDPDLIVFADRLIAADSVDSLLRSVDTVLADL